MAVLNAVLHGQNYCFSSDLTDEAAWIHELAIKDRKDVGASCIGVPDQYFPNWHSNLKISVSLKNILLTYLGATSKLFHIQAMREPTRIWKLCLEGPLNE